MTAPKWTRQLKWSGSELTLGDLRQFVKETAYLNDYQQVSVTSYDNPNGSDITIWVSGIKPYESTTPTELILIPPDAIYAHPYFNDKAGSYGYYFFNSERELLPLPEPEADKQ
jgi:hypothetical protein